MDAISLGKAGLLGWRSRVADTLAGPVARRSPLDEDDVRAAIGAAFFVLSVIHVVGTVRRVAATTR